jgi:hypothetical protein
MLARPREERGIFAAPADPCDLRKVRMGDLPQQQHLHFHLTTTTSETDHIRRTDYHSSSHDNYRLRLPLHFTNLQVLVPPLLLIISECSLSRDMSIATFQ